MSSLKRQDLLRAGASEEESISILKELASNDGCPSADFAEVWRRVSKHALSPDMPFPVHQLVASAVFRDWDERTQGPHPLWFPAPATAALTNVAAFMRAHPDLVCPPSQPFPSAAAGEINAPGNSSSTLRGASEPAFAARSACESGCGGASGIAERAARLHATSINAPERFWPPVLAALGVKWDAPPRAVLELEGGPDPDKCRWFPGGRINIARAALWDRDPEAPAIVYATEEEPRRLRTVTVGHLRRQAESVARGLIAAGLGPGDAVAIVMPMTPLAVAAYLGIVLMGAAVVSVAESFSTAEMAARLTIARAKAVFTQNSRIVRSANPRNPITTETLPGADSVPSRGWFPYAVPGASVDDRRVDVVLRGGKAHELYARVAAMPGARPGAIVLPADVRSGPAVPLSDGDVTWSHFLAHGERVTGFQPRSADPYEVTNVLFSSGTTGEPKSIPWTHLTPLRAAVDAWSCQDVRRGDLLLWPTSLGWMMGPWLVYAALLNSAALGLFLGSPVARPFGEFVESARVTVLGLVPSIAKAWRVTDCMRGLDWSCVRCFSSSGEASAPDDAHWLMARAGYKPIIEYCGGTEIGGAFCSGSMLHSAVPSTFSTLTLGMDVLLSPPDEHQCDADASAALVPMRSRAAARGEVMLRAPALGLSQTLLNRDHGAVYYRGMPALEHGGLGGARVPLRRHGDEFEVLPGGCYRALGRCDDTMNLGGIKVSSLELERACLKQVPDIVQAAAVAVPGPGGGPERLVLFVVLRAAHGSLTAAELSALTARCQDAIRQQLNPLFKLQAVLPRPSLPVNASNKVMRRVLRDQLMERPVARL